MKEARAMMFGRIPMSSVRRFTAEGRSVVIDLRHAGDDEVEFSIEALGKPGEVAVGLIVPPSPISLVDLSG